MVEDFRGMVKTSVASSLHPTYANNYLDRPTPPCTEAEGDYTVPGFEAHRATETPSAGLLV